MGRKSPNIKMQLNNQIDSLLRIGVKKVKDDPNNPNRCEGIHSIKTADTYRSVVNQFGDYLKQEHVRNISDISREHVQGFFDSRPDRSSYTYAKDLSAINKVLGTQYTHRDFGLPSRSYRDISNNRGLAERDTSQSLRNREALDFVRATGIRRESIGQITPDNIVRDRNGQAIGVHVIEKGGRERTAVILEQERPRITELVNQAIERNGSDVPFLREPDANANPHYCRAEYARQLYNDLTQSREEGRDYYQGMRETFINDQILHDRVDHYQNRTVHGYDRETIGEVSQNLGHNRLDVVLYHYLNK